MTRCDLCDDEDALNYCPECSYHFCNLCCEAVHEDKIRMDHVIQRAVDAQNRNVLSTSTDTYDATLAGKMMSSVDAVTALQMSSPPCQLTRRPARSDTMEAVSGSPQQNVAPETTVAPDTGYTSELAQLEERIGNQIKKIDVLQQHIGGNELRGSTVAVKPEAVGTDNEDMLEDIASLYGSARGSAQHQITSLFSFWSGSAHRALPLNHSSLYVSIGGGPHKEHHGASHNAYGSLRTSMNDIDVLVGGNSMRSGAHSSSASANATERLSSWRNCRNYKDGIQSQGSYEQEGHAQNLLRSSSPVNMEVKLESSWGHEAPFYASQRNSRSCLLGGEAPRCGLGVRLRHSNRGILSVAMILPGGAADKSGRLAANDQILAVNGVETSGKPIQDVAKMFVGIEGSSVDLKISRNGRGPFDVTIIRQGLKHYLPSCGGVNDGSTIAPVSESSKVVTNRGLPPRAPVEFHSTSDTAKCAHASFEQFESTAAVLKGSSSVIPAFTSDLYSSERALSSYVHAPAKESGVLDLHLALPDFYSSESALSLSLCASTKEFGALDLHTESEVDSGRVSAMFEASPLKVRPLFLHSDAPLFERPNTKLEEESLSQGIPTIQQPSVSSQSHAPGGPAALASTENQHNLTLARTTFVSPPPHPSELFTDASQSSETKGLTPPKTPPQGVPSSYKDYACMQTLPVYELPEEPASNTVSAWIPTAVPVNVWDAPLTPPANEERINHSRASMTPDTMAVFVRNMQISPSNEKVCTLSRGKATNSFVRAPTLSVKNSVPTQIAQEALQAVEDFEMALAAEMRREEEASVAEISQLAPSSTPEDSCLQRQIEGYISPSSRPKTQIREGNAHDHFNPYPLSRESIQGNNGSCSVQEVARDVLRDDVSVRTTETEKEQEKELEDSEMSARCTEPSSQTPFMTSPCESVVEPSPQNMHSVEKMAPTSMLETECSDSPISPFESHCNDSHHGMVMLHPEKNPLSDIPCHVPALYPAESNQVILEGWLLKETKGSLLKSTQKRWCVLKHGQLRYFHKKTDKTPAASINLAHVLGWNVDSSKNVHSLVITCKERVYKFLQPDKVTTFKWMQAMTKAIPTVQFSPSPGPQMPTENGPEAKSTPSTIEYNPSPPNYAPEMHAGSHY